MAAVASAQIERVAPDERMKILVVDDTPENLVSLAAALEDLNEHVVMARSGMELRHTP